MRVLGRHAIGLGLLLPGLLLTHAGAAETDSRAVTSPARKAAPKSATSSKRPADRPAERKLRSRIDVGPARRAVRPTIHVVRAGDSLSRIAARYKITRKALAGGGSAAGTRAWTSRPRPARPFSPRRRAW